MTPDELKEIRQKMHISGRGLAKLFRLHHSSIQAMEDGQHSIPAWIAEWMEGLGRWVKDHPPPSKRR